MRLIPHKCVEPCLICGVIEFAEHVAYVEQIASTMLVICNNHEKTIKDLKKEIKDLKKKKK